MTRKSSEVDIFLGNEKPPPRATRSGRQPAWLRRATAATFIHDFRSTYQELPEFTMYEQLVIGVSLHYVEDGLKAAVHAACLSETEDADYFYAAVHRYPRGKADRVVVCEARGGSLFHAIRNLAGVWLEQIKYEGKEVEVTRPLTQDPDELIEQFQASLEMIKKKNSP